MYCNPMMVKRQMHTGNLLVEISTQSLNIICVIWIFVALDDLSGATEGTNLTSIQSTDFSQDAEHTDVPANSRKRTKKRKLCNKGINIIVRRNIIYLCRWRRP